MWSYYADGHKGVCLRFRSNDLWELGLLVPVEYRSKYPTPSYYRDHIPTLYAMLGSKAEQWRHEAEWRLGGREAGHVSFPPSMLDGIIIGCRTPSDHVKWILGLITEREHPIEVYRASKAKSEYGLQIELLAK